MADRMLIRGGIVLTQDPTLGELPNADILVEGDRIKAIGPNLSADGAKVIDANGDIVIPGFIDTHRHTWETSIRTCAPDFALITYFGNILDKFAPHYRPDDVFAANQWGSLECINAGHHDAGRLVAHHEYAGPRGRGDPRPRGEPHPLGLRLRLSQHLASGLVVRARLRGQHPDQRRRRGPPDQGPVLQLRCRPDHDGPGDAWPGFCKPDVVKHDWALAKELDIRITVHVAMDRFGYTKLQVKALRDMNLLFPGTTYVHGSHFTDEEWGLVRESGGNVSFAPQIEIQMGHGWAPGVTATAYDVPIGLSSDVATTASSDQFTQMHAIFGSERGRKHQEAWEADLDGLQASPGLISARQVLNWATLGGAHVAGIADRTGSITPGKKADIVIIDGGAVNVAPVIDPVAAVVCAADVSNVKTVIVDGEILKDDFRLKASLGGPRKAVESSRDYLVEKFGEPEPGWLPRA